MLLARTHHERERHPDAECERRKRRYGHERARSEAESANRAKQRSLETETWKLVRSPGATGATYELFDLRADPGESHDVAPQHAAVADSLAIELDARVAADEARVGTADDRILDDTMREQMEALGYLGD